jgi:hypothetical protein
VSIETELQSLGIETEKWLCLLQAINPKHELLIYDFQGKTEQEKDVITYLFFMNFAPDGIELSKITNEVVLMSWKSFTAALHTAVVIEKARTGFLGQ